ncbi:MAG: hypothetical protein ABIB79_02970 [archaeon]
MRQVFYSLTEFQKEFFPEDHKREVMKGMVRNRQFDRLARYIVKKGIEFDYGLVEEINKGFITGDSGYRLKSDEITGKDVGSILAAISIETMRRSLQN